jgi:hypothetical protein
MAIPDPDFIIRTSGEWRLSNFLIWEAAYSESGQAPRVFGSTYPPISSPKQLPIMETAIDDSVDSMQSPNNSVRQRVFTILRLTPIISASEWDLWIHRLVGDDRRWHDRDRPNSIPRSMRQRGTRPLHGLWIWLCRLYHCRYLVPNQKRTCVGRSLSSPSALIASLICDPRAAPIKNTFSLPGRLPSVACFMSFIATIVPDSDARYCHTPPIRCVICVDCTRCRLDCAHPCHYVAR